MNNVKAIKEIFTEGSFSAALTVKDEESASTAPAASNVFFICMPLFENPLRE